MSSLPYCISSTTRVPVCWGLEFGVATKLLTEVRESSSTTLQFQCPQRSQQLCRDKPRSLLMPEIDESATCVQSRFRIIEETWVCSTHFHPSYSTTHNYHHTPQVQYVYLKNGISTFIVFKRVFFTTNQIKMETNDV